MIGSRRPPTIAPAASSFEGCGVRWMNETQNHHARCLDDVRKLSGVCGVTNKITIKQPSVDPSNVKSQIEICPQAPSGGRSEGHPGDRIPGNKVVIEGKVDNWDERRAVEKAAWSAPGVASVEDRLTIA